ncbi:MAG: DUF2970 domain-containing protein [Casimicrobiaceae bacterium]
MSAILAVLSAFVGIRRGGASLAERGVRPVHIVVAGILCAVLLVSTLVTIVRLVLP